MILEFQTPGREAKILEMMQPGQSASVEFSKKGPLGIATLNRPNSLNALDLTMFRLLRQQISEWVKDPSIAWIAIRGRGEKAFCAGGDVKGLVLELMKGSDTSYAKDFFVQEYSLDYLIHTCKKPIIVISHGLTFGGGIGLFAGAQLRVVSSSSVLSMPEISIGYFTDVGASYFLNQMPGKTGIFCALTAARLSPADAIDLGLADVFLETSPGEEWETISCFLDRFSECLPPPSSSRRRIIDRARECGALQAPPSGSGDFKKYQFQINQLCTANSVLEMAQNFRKAETEMQLPWSFQSFWSGSSTSAAVIVELLSRGVGKSLKQCLDQELNLALAFCRGQELREGVRALLIDKDKKPKWQPDCLEKLDFKQIESLFSGSLQIEVDA